MQSFFLQNIDLNGLLMDEEYFISKESLKGTEILNIWIWIWFHMEQTIVF
jgi:hypothetical protein